ncbi:heme exporter protein CcmB [Longimicrobium sp.]|uniref:heme exporter protein CcmB n=1 Tax=Longimicrobium sp. TaxID=2029185 RepID=UPI002BA46429|nr:heme exporter protein CcmB [Longimicrobium sp.]HSU17434.1 heme exporter protein CcmB [Longimicrobium sp.]
MPRPGGLVTEMAVAERAEPRVADDTASSEPAGASFLAQVWAVARKDLLLEARSRERVLSMGTFAVLVAVVFSFAVDPSIRARSIAGAMIWVTVLFAGTLGLGRSFALEKEADALTGVLLSPVDRGALFLGKWLANMAIVLAVEALIFPVFALFFTLSFQGSLPALAAVVVLATAGFMALGTLFGAVAAHTRLGETLIPILLLPLLTPVVIFACAATQRLLVGRPVSDVVSQLKMLGAFALIFLFVCTALFGAVVEE